LLEASTTRPLDHLVRFGVFLDEAMRLRPGGFSALASAPPWLTPWPMAATHDLWRGLGASAQAALETRQYARPPLVERLGTSGAEAAELVDGPSPDLADVWIPGVKIFRRPVYQQRHRGYFGEFARQGQGVLGEIGLWPRQWATALMDAGTAKGFHIHPPFIPPDRDPAEWFQQLFVTDRENYALRPYDREQWDAMFFVRGTVEMLLLDERAGMPRRRMRFIIEGDGRPGPSNVGLVIPAGVAHALRSASSEDVIMVYGTSTTFEPTFEGRLHSEVELAPLPEEWEGYWNQM
jgi:dTDP-4-dehydrorhamnose 3,5-epimerase-like enzyme